MRFAHKTVILKIQKETYIDGNGRHYVRRNDSWDTGPCIRDPKNSPCVVWGDVSMVNKDCRELKPTESEGQRQQGDSADLLGTRHVA